MQVIYNTMEREHIFFIGVIGVICIIIAIMIIMIIMTNSMINFEKLDQNFYDQKTIYPFLSNIDEYDDDINSEVSNLPLWIPWCERELYPSGSWKIIPFFAFGNWHDDNCKKSPKLTQFLKTIPKLKTAILSKLGPHTKLSPHQGWGDHSNHILKCHYGITVPQHCYLQVNDEKQYHKKKSWIVFDDSKTHFGSNDSDQERIVLIIDIERPSNVKTGSSTVKYSQELIDLVNEHFKK